MVRLFGNGRKTLQGWSLEGIIELQFKIKYLFFHCD
jgi:hypothetical protein